MEANKTKILQRNDFIKEILCYGDSNTWGYNPSTGERFDKSTRYTGVLKKTLGQNFHVYEQGLNGRTTVWDDPIEEWKNGKSHLIPCIMSQKPIDMFIIMLGTNDLKNRFSVTAYDIAASASLLCEIVRKSECGPNGNAPEILLISPIQVGDNIGDTLFGEMFGNERSVQISKQFPKYFSEFAKTYNYHYLDASLYANPSKQDAIHIDADGHYKLGIAISKAVLDIFES